MTRSYPHPHRTRLAVLGSPISHSRSPALHRAAYEVLDLDWTYGSADVTAAQLPAFISSLDDTWRGLSLTMPLKRDVLDLQLGSVDQLATQTGSANTLVLRDADASAANTDVFGIVEAVKHVSEPRTVQILGAGATAASAIVAAADLGATTVHLSARSPEKAARLVELARSWRMSATVGTLDERAPTEPDLVISTLPGGAATDGVAASPTGNHAVLLDVAYDPWPSALARRWESDGGRVVHGLEMLVAQAIGQLRLFLADDADQPLPDETRVRTAMRDAVGLQGG